MMRTTESFNKVRQRSVNLCEPLSIEDYVVQPSPDVSPPKWHLAHTTWFFDKFILSKQAGYEPFHEKYDFLFNSYYKTIGRHWKREERGALSRPRVGEIMEYRKRVDEQINKMLGKEAPEPVLELLEVGLHHEQQHQELLLMDIKAILSHDPGDGIYAMEAAAEPAKDIGETWTQIEEGCYEFGACGPGFSYDNEKPRHKRYLQKAAVRKELVTNGEFLEFIQDGGYQRPELWLSMGWDWIKRNEIKRPLYWSKANGQFTEYTLHGWEELNVKRPVQHVSYFEAAAFARWKGMRLPSEFEMEKIFEREEGESMPEGIKFHASNPERWQGELWCWTGDQYCPYPGYQNYSGSLGEYNQKFMCNQFVLKGGCYATPEGHLRTSYRNFFEPGQRWMFSGIRLAKDS